MSKVTFLSGEKVPLEMHKVRMVQKVNLLPQEGRLQSMQEAGFSCIRENALRIIYFTINFCGVNIIVTEHENKRIKLDIYSDFSPKQTEITPCIRTFTIT